MDDNNADLTVGTKLMIAINKTDADSYTSQVLDINDKIIIISGPIVKANLVAIHPNTILTISYYIEDVGRFIFKGIVKRRSIKKIYLLEIERITDDEKVQLRSYYRLFNRLPMLKYFEQNTNDILEEECITQDISGGGLRFQSNYEHKKGDIIECDIKIENKTVSVKGKIVRIKTTNDKKFKYSFGIKFFEVDQKSQEIIVKYVFEEQRKLRKKGLI